MPKYSFAFVSFFILSTVLIGLGKMLADERFRRSLGEKTGDGTGAEPGANALTPTTVSDRISRTKSFFQSPFGATRAFFMAKEV